MIHKDRKDNETTKSSAGQGSKPAQAHRHRDHQHSTASKKSTARESKPEKPKAAPNTSGPQGTEPSRTIRTSRESVRRRTSSGSRIHVSDSHRAEAAEPPQRMQDKTDGRDRSERSTKHVTHDVHRPRPQKQPGPLKGDSHAVSEGKTKEARPSARGLSFIEPKEEFPREPSPAPDPNMSHEDSPDAGYPSPRSQYLAKEIRRLTKATLEVPKDLQQPDDVQSPSGAAALSPGAKAIFPPNVSQLSRTQSKRRSTHEASRALPDAPSSETKTLGKKKSSPEVKARFHKAILLPILVALSIVISGVIMVIMLFHHYTSEKGIVAACNTPECIKIRGSIDDLLNISVHPCDDFYAYVCSKWIHRPRSGFIQDIFSAYAQTIVLAVSSQALARPSPDGMHVLKKLYESCYQYVKGTKSSFKDAVEQVKNLLDIEKLVNAATSAELLGNLLAIGLRTGIHSSFSVQFHLIGSRHIFTVAPGSSVTGKLQRMLAGQPSHSLDALHDFTMQFVEEVLNETHGVKDSHELAENLTQVDIEIYYLFMRTMIVSEVQFRNLIDIFFDNNPMDVIKLINDIVPDELRVHIDDNIWVIGFDLLRGMHRTLGTGGFIATKLYHFANVAAGLLRYYVVKDMARADQGLLSSICMRSTRTALTHTWPYLIARLSGYHGSAQVALDIATATKGALLHRNVLHMFDDYTKAEAKAALDNMKIVTYDVSELSSLGPVANYTSWNLEGDFFSILVRATTLETAKLLRELPDRDVSTLSENQLNNNMTYTATDGVLTVPTAYQGPPLLYFREVEVVPFYFNYATLGTLMAKEMVHIMAEPFQKSRKAKKQLASALSCLKKVTAAHGLGIKEAITDTPWESDLVLWSFASRTMFAVVKRVLLSQGQSVFDENWDAAQHYFFVRYCMMWCTSRDKGSARRQRALFAERCLVPVAANQYFINRYDCSKRQKFKSDPCVRSFFGKVSP